MNNELRYYYEEEYLNCRLVVDNNIYTNDSIKIYQSTFHKGYSTNLFRSYHYTYHSALESYFLFA